MSTPKDPCYCQKPGCIGTRSGHDAKVMNSLLPAWHGAMKNAKSGYDEPESLERASDLADQINAELDRCSPVVQQEAAKHGLYANEPINVGGRDLGQ